MTASDSEDGGTVGFNPSRANLFEEIREYAAEHPVIDSMNVEFQSFEDGALTATIPYNDTFANPGMDGTYHGGILVTMLDTVMGLAFSATLAGDDSKLSGPTMTLTTHFHDTTTEDFEVVGDVVRVGSSSAFIEGRIRSADSQELLTSAEGHWRVYDR